MHPWRAGQDGSTHNQSYTVNPQSAQSTDQGKSITYSADNLDNNTTYTLELFSCDNVTTGRNGQTTFVQTTQPTSTTSGSGDAAQGSLGQTSFSVVNGGTASGTKVTTQPSNGSITFTVLDSDSGSAPVCVVPVLYNDANQSGTLNVDKTSGAPTEAFGAGGAATFNSPAATAGNYDANVLSVNKTDGTFVGDTTPGSPGGVMVFTYNGAGNQYYNEDGTYVPITEAQFSNWLSGKMSTTGANDAPVVGDIVGIDYNPSGLSDFYFNQDVPAAPSNLTATYQPAVTTGTTHPDQVALTWTAPSNLSVSGYDVWRATVDAKGNVGSFSSMGTTGANTTTYNGQTVSGNTKYVYEVAATEAANSVEGPVSNQATASTPAPSYDPLPASAVDKAAAPESGSGNYAGDTVAFTPVGGSFTTAQYAADVADFATVSDGQVTVQPYTVVNAANVTRSTNQGNGDTGVSQGDQLALWNVNGTTYYVDLTTETPAVGATGKAYVGVSVTNTGGTVSMANANGSDSNTTDTDSFYIAVAKGATGGVAFVPTTGSETIQVTTAGGGSIPDGTYNLTGTNNG